MATRIKKVLGNVGQVDLTEDQQKKARDNIDVNASLFKSDVLTFSETNDAQNTITVALKNSLGVVDSNDIVVNPDSTSVKFEFKTPTITGLSQTTSAPKGSGGKNVITYTKSNGTTGTAAEFYNGVSPTVSTGAIPAELKKDGNRVTFTYKDDSGTDQQTYIDVINGPKGDQGISPTVETTGIIGGNRVTFKYGESGSTYIDVKDGISPTVSTESVPGGNKVTFTYGSSKDTKSITVYDGATGDTGPMPDVTLAVSPYSGGIVFRNTSNNNLLQYTDGFSINNNGYIDVTNKTTSSVASAVRVFSPRITSNRINLEYDSDGSRGIWDSVCNKMILELDSSSYVSMAPLTSGALVINNMAYEADSSSLIVTQPNSNLNAQPPRILLEYDSDGTRGIWDKANAGESGNWILEVTGASNSKKTILHGNVDGLLYNTHTDEINFGNVTKKATDQWFNYRNGDTDLKTDADYKLINYYFGNRLGETTGVILHAEKFAGEAERAYYTRTIYSDGLAYDSKYITCSDITSDNVIDKVSAITSTSTASASRYLLSMAKVNNTQTIYTRVDATNVNVGFSYSIRPYEDATESKYITCGGAGNAATITKIDPWKTGSTSTINSSRYLLGFASINADECTYRRVSAGDVTVGRSISVVDYGDTTHETNIKCGWGGDGIGGVSTAYVQDDKATEVSLAKTAYLVGIYKESDTEYHYKDVRADKICVAEAGFASYAQNDASGGDIRYKYLWAADRVIDFRWYDNGTPATLDEYLGNFSYTNPSTSRASSQFIKVTPDDVRQLTGRRIVFHVIIDSGSNATAQVCITTEDKTNVLDSVSVYIRAEMSIEVTLKTVFNGVTPEPLYIYAVSTANIRIMRISGEHSKYLNRTV